MYRNEERNIEEAKLSMSNMQIGEGADNQWDIRVKNVLAYGKWCYTVSHISLIKDSW